MSRVNQGHYIAFAKKNDSWWKFDDSQVSIVDVQTIDDDATGQAYLLFFARS